MKAAEQRDHYARLARSAGRVSFPFTVHLLRDAAPCELKRLDVISLVGQHKSAGLAQPGLDTGKVGRMPPLGHRGRANCADVPSIHGKTLSQK